MRANTEFWRFVECQKSNTSYRVPKMHRMLYLYTVSLRSGPEHSTLLHSTPLLSSTPLYPSTLLYYSTPLLSSTTLGETGFAREAGQNRSSRTLSELQKVNRVQLKLQKTEGLLFFAISIEPGSLFRPHLYHAKKNVARQKIRSLRCEGCMLVECMSLFLFLLTKRVVEYSLD